jgi:hypothetical protein
MAEPAGATRGGSGFFLRELLPLSRHLSAHIGSHAARTPESSTAAAGQQAAPLALRLACFPPRASPLLASLPAAAALLLLPARSAFCCLPPAAGFAAALAAAAAAAGSPFAAASCTAYRQRSTSTALQPVPAGQAHSTAQCRACCEGCCHGRHVEEAATASLKLYCSRPPLSCARAQTRPLAHTPVSCVLSHAALLLSASASCRPSLTV